MTGMVSGAYKHTLGLVQNAEKLAGAKIKQGEVVGFGIFVNLGEEEKYSFMFDTKEEMDEAAGRIAAQLQ